MADTAAAGEQLVPLSRYRQSFKERDESCTVDEGSHVREAVGSHATATDGWRVGCSRRCHDSDDTAAEAWRPGFRANSEARPPSDA